MDTIAPSSEICQIPFRVYYRGKEAAGIASGAAFPANRAFNISLLGNSFLLTAESGGSSWQWRTNAPENPLSVLGAEIGLAIEQHFGRKGPGAR